MEFRINAEDPFNEFDPTPGPLETYQPPTGVGIRVDNGVNEGDTISPFYDSLIAKFIVTARNRTETIARSKRALKETEIDSISTTIPFHLAVLNDEVFIESDHTTKYLDQQFDGVTGS